MVGCKLVYSRRGFQNYEMIFPEMPNGTNPSDLCSSWHPVCPCAIQFEENGLYTCTMHSFIALSHSCCVNLYRELGRRVGLIFRRHPQICSVYRSQGGIFAPALSPCEAVPHELQRERMHNILEPSLPKPPP